MLCISSAFGHYLPVCPIDEGDREDTLRWPHVSCYRQALSVCRPPVEVPSLLPLGLVVRRRELFLFPLACPLFAVLRLGMTGSRRASEHGIGVRSGACRGDGRHEAYCSLGSEAGLVIVNR